MLSKFRTVVLGNPLLDLGGTVRSGQCGGSQGLGGLEDCGQFWVLYVKRLRCCWSGDGAGGFCGCWVGRGRWAGRWRGIGCWSARMPGRLEKGSRDCDGGVGWEEACRFLGAGLVAAFWAGVEGVSAGAAGAGGAGLSSGDGDGVSGR